jgi:DNA topoisomerase-1
MSENEEGKATGWSAWCTDDKWIVEDKRKKPKK